MTGAASLRNIVPYGKTRPFQVPANGRQCAALASGALAGGQAGFVPAGRVSCLHPAAFHPSGNRQAAGRARQIARQRAGGVAAIRRRRFRRPRHAIRFAGASLKVLGEVAVSDEPRIKAAAV